MMGSQQDLNAPGIRPDADGLIRLPDAPGLGVAVHAEAIRQYLQPLTIMIVAMGCYLMIVPV